jgi:hypothetical protein
MAYIRFRQQCSSIFAALILASLPSLMVGSDAASSSPPMPHEDFGACPFEGCVYGEWGATDAVAVHASRSPTAPIVFSIRKGEWITVLTGVVVTTSPGQVRFREPIELSSRSGPLRVEPGETLYLLTYRGEGFTQAWFKGEVYEDVDGGLAFFNALCDTSPARCVGTIVVQPQRIWWVQVRNAKGQVGWTADSNKLATKDSLGE